MTSPPPSAPSNPGSKWAARLAVLIAARLVFFGLGEAVLWAFGIEPLSQREGYAVWQGGVAAGLP